MCNYSANRTSVRESLLGKRASYPPPPRAGIGAIVSHRRPNVQCAGTSQRRGMGKVYEALTEDLQTFIQAQHVFFVATAPLSAEGHINLSPKGLDSFRILSPN